MNTMGIVVKTVMTGAIVIGLIVSTGDEKVRASEGLNVVINKIEGNSVGYKTDSGKLLNLELETVSATAGLVGVEVKITGDKLKNEPDILTSIYSKYEHSVKPLNEKRKKLAIDELQLMVDVKESKNVVSSRGNVTGLFVKMKEEMYKQAKLDTELTDAEINTALKSSYKRNKLDKTLTPKQKESIKVFALRYRDLELVKNDVIPEQLRSLGNYTNLGAVETLKFTGNALKERVESLKFVDGVKNFFSELAEALNKLFNKTETQ